MSIKYEKEFKEMIVGLVESGQSVKLVASDYQVPDRTVRKWIPKGLPLY
ncbi:transposase [Limibacter armeniacum]